jgi:hypothetical protein
VREANDVSKVRCAPEPKQAHGLGSEVWVCDLTTAPSGRKVEIEILVGVSLGDYSMLDCRTGPHQPYHQQFRGICRRID